MFGKKKQKTDDKDGLYKSAPRVGKAGRRRFPVPPAAVLAVAAALGIALLVILVWRTTAWLFWENPDYALKTLSIHIDGQSINPQTVRDLTGISEGTNLFAVGLAEAATRFLKKKPEVKSISLQRKLPDAMTIDVAERTTVARLGRWGSFGVDHDGWVFPIKPGGRELPVVSGCSESSLRPGARADQAVLDAIDALEACTRSHVGERVHIASIDVSAAGKSGTEQRGYVELYLAGGERIRLSWPGMGTPAPEARAALDRKLAQLASALRVSEERGHRLVNLDLTFHDQYAPAQEY